MRTTAATLPSEGFIALRAIIGNARAEPPIPPILPVSRSTWLAGVRSGRYPKPVKLAARRVAWRVEDIRSLLERLANEGAAHG